MLHLREPSCVSRWMAEIICGRIHSVPITRLRNNSSDRKYIRPPGTLPSCLLVHKTYRWRAVLHVLAKKKRACRQLRHQLFVSFWSALHPQFWCWEPTSSRWRPHQSEFPRLICNHALWETNKNYEKILNGTTTQLQFRMNWAMETFFACICPLFVIHLILTGN